ncbi:hypothetical protein [Streptomyces avicenniae]|uniref:hypothetical protein n=1 Tax=Streptomyces avicenniae TaxID=500153 RepID=UPI00069C4D0B|nr:hypothetical protein [Streptomyces avicenniae]
MTERDPGLGDGRDPIDEEAAWAQIVAGYGDEPADPPGVWPKAAEIDLTDTVDRVLPSGESAAAPPLGPRDWDAAEDEEEAHFVPPEPPPLPEAALSTKLAWVAVIGGPLLLIVTVLLQQRMTWWIVTLGVGGFLGGFATLVTRLRDGHDDDWTEPGNGAVV